MRLMWIGWCGVLVLLASALFAHPGIPEPFLDVEILDTTAAPGGTAQIVLQLTEPKPITTGEAWLDVGIDFSLIGVYLFSPNGDVSGAVTQFGRRLRVRFDSPSGTYGMNQAYAPIMVLTLTIDPNAQPGQRIPIRLDDLASFWNDPAGIPWPQVVRHGTITVGGTVSINDVSPAGDVKAGTEVDVRGFGFQPGAALTITGLDIAFLEFENANRLEFKTLADVELEGQVVQVVNPDLSSASYICYERPNYTRSTVPLLAATTPVFSDQLWTGASFGPLSTGKDHGPPKVAGLAFANPWNSGALAEIRIETYSQSGRELAEGTIKVSRGQAVVFELSELLPALGDQSGVTVVARSKVPVKMLALQGDQSQKALTPVLPTPLPAGSQ